MIVDMYISEENIKFKAMVILLRMYQRVLSIDIN